MLPSSENGLPASPNATRTAVWMVIRMTMATIIFPGFLSHSARSPAIRYAIPIRCSTPKILQCPIQYIQFSPKEAVGSCGDVGKNG